MTPEEKLQELGIVLPSAPNPLASYVPACLAGDLLFVSGVLPFQDGKLTLTGKLGQELSTEQGYEASQTAVLNALAIIQQELGTLERVKQIVRMTGYVASATGFSEQPAVINGASDFLVQVFGEFGRHARLAVGAAELPLHAPVELELIVQVIT
ncbi:MAG: LysR family transcriptional regulator [Nitrospirales bacterium]|nr:MAG: LysR family transcriptional regulator [Nitrospirales bacterium]